MSDSRCRRYHPVWMTHAQMSDVLAVLESQQVEGSYFGNRRQFEMRLRDSIAAVEAAIFNCIDENERPSR